MKVVNVLPYGLAEALVQSSAVVGRLQGFLSWTIFCWNVRLGI